jgi:hypothetical protein
MKPFWSISEACVWAATLDPDAVDAVNGRNPDDVYWLMPDTPPDAYSDHFLAWHSSLREGRPSVREAFKALGDLCADGALTMHGFEHGTGCSGPIPTDAWAGIALVTIARRGLVAARRGSEVLDPEALWWSDLTIRSADVLKVWPIEPRPAAKRDVGPKSSKREAVKAYIRNTYPGGRVPHDVKNESIAAAVGVHEKTVRRAMIEIGRNTDK